MYVNTFNFATVNQITKMTPKYITHQTLLTRQKAIQRPVLSTFKFLMYSLEAGYSDAKSLMPLCNSGPLTWRSNVNGSH
jgi:hypothetical protein